jgi:hypothetical protein
MPLSGSRRLTLSDSPPLSRLEPPFHWPEGLLHEGRMVREPIHHVAEHRLAGIGRCQSRLAERRLQLKAMPAAKERTCPAGPPRERRRSPELKMLEINEPVSGEYSADGYLQRLIALKARGQRAILKQHQAGTTGGQWQRLTRPVAQQVNIVKSLFATLAGDRNGPYWLRRENDDLLRVAGQCG